MREEHSRGIDTMRRMRGSWGVVLKLRSCLVGVEIGKAYRVGSPEGSKIPRGTTGVGHRRLSCVSMLVWVVVV